MANRWAPDGDGGNNSLAYTKRIAAGIRIGIDDKLHHADNTVLTLVQARISIPAF